MSSDETPDGLAVTRLCPRCHRLTHSRMCPHDGTPTATISEVDDGPGSEPCAPTVARGRHDLAPRHGPARPLPTRSRARRGRVRAVASRQS